MGPVSQQTPSVHLRELVAADADVLAGWAGDEVFCREAEWSPGLPFEVHRDFHRGLIASPPPELLRLGVVSGGDLVGFVDLHGLEPHRRELGFTIGGRSRWGRGLGGAAARAGLAYGFEALELTEIWAEALDANERSVRLLRRLGMDETGHGDDSEFCGTPTYYRQFALTCERSPWTASRV